MKRTLIAAAVVGALAILPVAAAAPAHASNDLNIRVDPRDWTWSGTISIGPKNICDENGNNCGIYEADASKSFTVTPGSGLQEILSTSMDWTDDDLNVFVSDSVLTNGETTYVGATMWISIDDPPVGEMMPTPLYDGTQKADRDRGAIVFSWNFAKLGDGYELKFYPSVWVPTAQNVSATGNVTVSQTDATDTATPRSKNTRYVTDQPGRVTAMAKRFIAAPGDVINIHGYGPDRDVALARAEHVRAHLKSEIARLGGDPDAYPTFVVYAGDPSHKKNVHVTIHQHAASVSTVPDGETLRLGGDE